MGEIFLDDSRKVLSCLVTGREQMKAYLGTVDNGILNTEDFPYLEFESPRYGYGDQPLLDNLDELLKFRTAPARLIKEQTGGPDFSDTLGQFANAVPAIIEGHREYRELRILEATKHYMKALELAPQDRSIKDLLNFGELRRKIKGQPNNWWARWMLGEAMALQHRDGEAVTTLDEFIAMQGDIRLEPFRGAKVSALKTLMSIYDRLKKPEKSAEYRALLAQLETIRNAH